MINYYVFSATHRSLCSWCSNKSLHLFFVCGRKWSILHL